MNKHFKALVGAAAALALTAGICMAADITGAGSTFVFPIVAKWATVYKGVSGNNLNYQSIGSGGGIAQIKAKTVTFGASDKPLTSKELRAAGLIQFPIIIGGIVPVINIRGIGPGQLTLDGPTLTAIYQGKVSRWDDASIKKLNPGLKLPSQGIVVVHRADGSGTTFQFTTYLSRVSAEWKEDVGADTAIEWPVGIGAKGNEGVAGNVMQINGSIGYVEYAFAKQNQLSHAKMINRAGKTVQPTVESFRAAAAVANWVDAAKSDFYMLFLDQPGPNSWPITATTFALMYKQPSNEAVSAEALKFFKWGFEKGGDVALSLDYIPLPPNAVGAIEASWKDIKGSGM